MRRALHAVVHERSVEAGDLQRRERQALPEADVVGGDLAPIVEGKQVPQVLGAGFALARIVHARLRVQVVLVDLVVEVPEPRHVAHRRVLGGQRDADVRRLVHDLPQRVRGVSALVRIPNDVAVGLDGGRAEQLGVGRHGASFQDGHGRHRLEDGARLEQVGHAFELRRIRFHIRPVGRIEQRQRCRGVDLSRAAVHHDGAAAVGRDALGIGRQALLDGLLQLYVDGYDDVLAVHGRLGVARAAGNGRAVGAALLARVARLA